MSSLLIASPTLSVIPKYFYQKSILFKDKDLWIPDKRFLGMTDNESLWYKGVNTIRERILLITPIKKQKLKVKIN